MSATHPHIQEAFAPLTGEHRMEVVADKDGVRYINNSHATNLNAAWYALELMPPGRRVHWLVGGGGYDGDHGDADAWRALLPVAREKVKAIYDVSVPLNLPMKVAFAGHVIGLELRCLLEERIGRERCEALGFAGLIGLVDENAREDRCEVLTAREDEERVHEKEPFDHDDEGEERGRDPRTKNMRSIAVLWGRYEVILEALLPFVHGMIISRKNDKYNTPREG
jgi:hypothetical protein